MNMPLNVPRKNSEDNAENCSQGRASNRIVMTADKKPNELSKQPYFLRDTDDLRRKLNREIADLEAMAKAGYIETTDGQNIGTSIAVRMSFLTRIQPPSCEARW